MGSVFSEDNCKRAAPSPVRVNVTPTNPIEVPSSTFRLIPDQYRTFDELSAALRAIGFENCDVVLAIDFTGSNRTQGKRTFFDKDLHHPHELVLNNAKKSPPSSISPPTALMASPSAPPPYSSSSLGEEVIEEGKINGDEKIIDIAASSYNPYQLVMSTMTTALETLNPAKRIYTVGFGDTSTEDVGIFCLKKRSSGSIGLINDFNHDCQPCFGVDDVMNTYKQSLPFITKSGPTSFVPLIEKVMKRAQSTRRYCFLFIIGDGAVTDKDANAAAVIQASRTPMSISFIGVGDGPWDTMREFDDNLPERAFDNWQSVDFYTKMNECGNNPLRFATLALQEAPDQLRAIKQLKLM